MYVSADIQCSGAIASQCDYKCAKLDGKDTCVCKTGLRLKANSTSICQGKMHIRSYSIFTYINRYWKLMHLTCTQ